MPVAAQPKMSPVTNASLRRLAKDHAALRSALPPNYLFPDSDHGSSLQDDLTQLVVCITGAEGTPYSEGLWRLHLKMPPDYPKSPPKAAFQTRIYHPNVDPTTGAVCLETLKRDWDPKLTLKDILVTISCLLIQPNPDSALNAAAGALIQESYDSFSTQAQLMTRIHAPIPKHLSDAVQEAKRRGEEPEHGSTEKPSSSRGKSLEDDTKENEPSESNTAFNCAPNRMKDKRALSEIALPEESDVQTSSEAIEPKRKSPKTTRASAPDQSKSVFPAVSGELETHKNEHEEQTMMAQNKPSLPCQLPTSISTAARKISNTSAAKKRLPRIGIRRL
ncbi:uncharacterized protein Z519_03852 [Cladophialophora bantiana CBS 173.52]|uniref:UBC core domain-containing protein n=1 Tax=Cladophialophora bantiana (strain ATCC 10958 / CBS 173.52 / CDC B-1940 / NIH 8579) TaxID=1442370 RepID=A0A0D2HPE4_CLAB1|nr:uncharacterized protein Z519_03852 [Cladophialophora bantiana CBS 173.52]KIW95268.1 hypothetical protein Z519_03852 [Cladophialophora bantiana CBS 173.52]